MRKGFKVRMLSNLLLMLIIFLFTLISRTGAILGEPGRGFETTAGTRQEKSTENCLKVQGSGSATKERCATDLRSLMRSLRAAGLVLRQGGRVSQPFFSAKGRILKVNGEDLQVFEYANRTLAEKDAEKITPKGSAVGTSMPMWIAPPHFYTSGRLIALYVGRSSAVIKGLERALGPQFAGQ